MSGESGDSMFSSMHSDAVIVNLRVPIFFHQSLDLGIGTVSAFEDLWLL